MIWLILEDCESFSQRGAFVPPFKLLIGPINNVQPFWKSSIKVHLLYTVLVIMGSTQICCPSYVLLYHSADITGFSISLTLPSHYLSSCAKAHLHSNNLTDSEIPRPPVSHTPRTWWAILHWLVALTKLLTDRWLCTHANSEFWVWIRSTLNTNVKQTISNGRYILSK